MNLRVRTWLVILLLLVASAPSTARELLIARSPAAFAEAMLALQESIRKHGYHLSRVQRVDVGLTTSGFKTDKYRVVFFGRPDEIHRLGHAYPDLVPYLPLKIAIFAEGDQTLLVAANPALLKRFYHHPKLAPVFDRWARDVQTILDDVRTAE
ncbi:MAG: DUF302 domain-containing protein [Gammaproteobacteria bacterium]|nr:MAG: DUF302 domain-containing protein [Gammaproteobacteria bacterium]